MGNRQVEKEIQSNGMAITVATEVWILGEDASQQLTRQVGIGEIIQAIPSS